MEGQVTWCIVGIQNGLQNTDWNVTIPTCLWEDLSPACWAKIQSSLGYQKMEHGFGSNRNKKEDATLRTWWMARKSIS
jgi:hypothetical protein